MGGGEGRGARGEGIWDMGYGIWDMGYGIWDMGYGIWDMGWPGEIRFAVTCGEFHRLKAMG